MRTMNERSSCKRLLQEKTHSCMQMFVVNEQIIHWFLLAGMVWFNLCGLGLHLFIYAPFFVTISS